VLEDDFATDRPPLESAGVQLVARAEPYEILKLRMLNAGHQALGYLGYLAGHRFVHEAIADPVLAAFFRAFTDEVEPSLPRINGINPIAYREQLIDRFGNPAVGDSLERICAYSSDRIPKFVLPTVYENLSAGRGARFAAAVIAGWARYCEGQDEQGRVIPLVDPLADALSARARAQTRDPLAFLDDRSLFRGLAGDAAFTQPYLDTLHRLHRDGARATLAALVRSEAP
jgi:mannitol 2-dehydrogenase